MHKEANGGFGTAMAGTGDAVGPTRRCDGLDPGAARRDSDVRNLSDGWPIFVYHWGMTLSDRIVESVDLHLPDLPPAAQGLRIAHLTDLHIHGNRRRHHRIADLLGQMQPDLIVFTGDYTTRWRPSGLTRTVLATLCDAFDPPLGMYGVYGNHDSEELRAELDTLPITWLDNAVHGIDDPPLDIWGVDTHYRNGHDSVALADRIVAAGRSRGEDVRPVRLLLCHVPSFLPTASDLGADVMLAGHTHGGQIRLPGGRAMRNSTDLPLPLTSGLLRHRNTLCCTSRGLGEVLLPIRVFCPPQLPVYTLQRGPMPGACTDHIENVMPW